MQITQDIGLVLKKTLYQDTKLIVNVFTKQAGLIAFSVLFTKKTTHRLGCFEPGHLLKLDLKKTGDHYRLHDSSVLFAPKSLKENFKNICLWAQFLDTLYKLLAPHQALPLFFDFIKNGIIALDSLEQKETLVWFIYLKWLQQEGLWHASGNIQSEVDALLEKKRFSEVTGISLRLQEEIRHQLDLQLV